MNSNQPIKSVGYFIKMFPRLSETFILNEILELERNGVEVVIFSIKKPNEGRFHSQVADIKAKVFYLDDLDTKKWQHWIGAEWPQLSPVRSNIWQLLDETLESKDFRRMDWIWWSAWAAAQSLRLGLSHLHAHFATLPSTMAYLVHRISGIPFTFTAHAKDIFVYDTESHLLEEKAEAASAIVTVTNFNLRYLKEKLPGLDHGKIRVVHNGINIEHFQLAGSPSREENLIIAVGRLVIKKGFNYLLEACSLLKERGVPFRCVIVGDGNEKENLHEQCRTLQLEEEVEFAGPMNLDEVASLMGKATIMCLPCVQAPDSNVDALPTVLLEALACGTPIISTKISGVPEIVTSGEDGLLVEPEDPGSLSREIERLLSSKQLQEKFAQKGRLKAAEKFDLHKNVRQLLQVFSEASQYVTKSDAVIQEDLQGEAYYEK